MHTQICTRLYTVEIFIPKRHKHKPHNALKRVGKWLKRSCSQWLLLFCYIAGSQLFKIHTLHSASKQQRTPLSLRICAPHFSPHARINYELINITLWSGYFSFSSLSLSVLSGIIGGRVRETQRGGIEIWTHCVLMSKAISRLWIRECVCVEFVSPGKPLNISWRGINTGRMPPPPNLIHTAIRGPLSLSQPLRSVQTRPQKQQ